MNGAYPLGGFGFFSRVTAKSTAFRRAEEHEIGLRRSGRQSSQPSDRALAVKRKHAVEQFQYLQDSSAAQLAKASKRRPNFKITR
jgi:hypothetical protein